MNGFDEASKPPTTSMSRPMTTLLTCWQFNNQLVRERHDERGGSAMREVLAAAMQQRMTR
jgi:hypothetical protein